MATALKPEMEARIADLAKRLGLVGPNAAETVLRMALEHLEASAPNLAATAEANPIEFEYRMLSAAGRQWREAHPDEYVDKSNPPSRVWQDELYDENGLPK